jgi:hypothetical protein
MQEKQVTLQPITPKWGQSPTSCEKKRAKVVAEWSHLPKPTLSTKNTPSLTHGPRKARKHFFMTLYNNTIGTITLNIKVKSHDRRKLMIN